ncbi:MAG: stalk domain-containing protein [Oscillospiraceae bacterium]|nr:stalk domain-containing protein [Oscillospiraceae bacterium]
MKKRFVGIALAVLMLFALIPATGLAADTWQTATTLAKDTPATFTIEATNDVKWYKLTVPSADQTINISVDKVDGGGFAASININLYEGNTLMGGRENSIYGTGNFSVARDNFYRKLTDAGDYYLKIAGGINLSALRIKYTLIGPDAYENNDEWKNAKQMTMNSPISFTITASNDVDWFKLTVPSADQTINFIVDRPEGGGFENSVNINLYEGNTLMGGRENSIYGTGNFSVARDNFYRKLTDAGDYYIKITGGVNLSALRIRYALVAPDAYENNDEWKNATPMVKDTPMSFTITATNDVDWFKVSVPNADETIKIGVTRPAGGGFESSANINLYEGSTLMGGRETSIYGTGNFSVTREFERKLTNAGDYYLKVSGGTNFDPLSITCNFGYPGAVIKNPGAAPDTTPTPTPVPTNPGAPTLSYSAILAEGDATQTVGVRLTWTPVQGITYYRVYRAEVSGGYTYPLTDFAIEGTSYVDVKLREGRTYCYIVRALISEGDAFAGLDETLGPVSNEVWTEEIDPVPCPRCGKINCTEHTKQYILMQIDNPMMEVNGNIVEVDPGQKTAPMIRNDRTMLPIRAVVETMDGEVSWDAGERKVTLDACDNLVLMWIGNYDYVVNNENREMDIVPFIEGGRTYLPLRFAAENLNCRVTWLNATKEILIVYGSDN